jgi:hypothetical protein
MAPDADTPLISCSQPGVRYPLGYASCSEGTQNIKFSHNFQFEGTAAFDGKKYQMLQGSMVAGGGVGGIRTSQANGTLY